MWLIVFSSVITIFSLILVYLNYRILVVEKQLLDISQNVLKETIRLRKSFEITEDN
jgi:cell division protein FtsL